MMVVDGDDGGGWWWWMVVDGGGWWCSLSLVPSRAALEQYQCIFFFLSRNLLTFTNTISHNHSLKKFYNEVCNKTM